MKTILPFLITCILSASLSAQESKPNFKHQFCFDAGTFISRFFNFSGSGISNQLYQATFRELKENKNVRWGLAFNFNVEAGGGQGTNSNSVLLLRVGGERFKDFGAFRKNHPHVRSWRAFYGWDFKVQFNFTSLEFTEGDNIQLALGPSPFFGLLYQINDRLSVSTELSYDIMFYWRDVNDQSRYGAFNLFNAPTSIFVNYNF